MEGHEAPGTSDRGGWVIGSESLGIRASECVVDGKLKRSGRGAAPIERARENSSIFLSRSRSQWQLTTALAEWVVIAIRRVGEAARNPEITIAIPFVVPPKAPTREVSNHG